MYAALLVLFVVIVLAGAWECDRAERREDEIDRELWLTMPGATE